MKKRLSVRGVSPVIATVLLIAMVIVIAAIIFLWFSKIGGETITKLGKNIEMVCNDVEFTASYDSNLNLLYISNTGNVPIFNINVKIEKDGDYETYNIKEDFTSGSDWPSLGLSQGGISSIDISGYSSGASNIILTPVLIGASDKGERSYACKENQYGYEISI